MKEENYSVHIEDEINGVEMLKSLEKKGRTCYKSEHKITEDSYFSFISDIIKKHHESVLEHEKISVRVICDRGVSHQIVRHRLGSYSQESTRYCNYSNDRFGHQITVIKPPKLTDEQYLVWQEAMTNAEASYFKLIEIGATTQTARAVLPFSVKTEIVVTYNLREWRHFLKVRTIPEAHPQIREIAFDILKKFKKLVPVVFDDISEEKDGNRI